MNFLEPIWAKHYTKLLVICYWILGLCNNFAYVVMLSAAHDILEDHTNSSTNTSSSNHSNKFDCNNISTGAVLLADIIPGIIIKLTAPFFVHHFKYSTRVSLVVISNIASYLLVALSPPNMKWLTFIGVCCASFGSSFGEITFLSLSTFYNRLLALGGWGSGTGAAGVGGSLGYAGLTSIGVKPRDAILIMLFIPVLMALSYIVLPTPTRSLEDDTDSNETETEIVLRNNQDRPSSRISEYTELDAESRSCFSKETFIMQLKLLKKLQKYMIPLFLVYFAEYFINQGLFELLYFKDAFIKNHKEQYRWYNVCYQVAVFVSRSSITFFQVKFLPIFPILQLLNVGIVLAQLFFNYIPSIWIVFVIIFWEGLLGGKCLMAICE